MTSSLYSTRTDAPWRAAGTGMAIGWRCMGCQQPRSSTAGSKGAGVKKRCSVCVAVAAAKKAGG